MSGLFFTYLANGILRGGAIMLLLWLVERCCRRRLIFAGGKWLYLLAVALILLPVEHISAFRTAAAVPEYYSIEMSQLKFAAPAQVRLIPTETEKENVPLQPEIAPVPAASPSPAPAVGSTPLEKMRPNPAQSDFSERFLHWLFLFYLAAAAVLSAKQLYRCFQWRNRIRRCIAITGGRVYEIFLQSKRSVKLEERPIVLREGGALRPVAACFGTPRHGTVLCPLSEYAMLPDAELRMILIHELEHLRRYDNPVAFFLTLLANLFFPNVFLRFLINRWAMVAELDCDEKVRFVLQLDRQGQARYAELLLASQSGGRVALPGRRLGSSARNLKLRIQKCFMKRSKQQIFATLTGISLLFCLGVLLLPELRAEVPREPIPEFVAEHLPTDTQSLILFRTKDLDEEGSELLEKAVFAFSNLNESTSLFLSFMMSAERNRGILYWTSRGKPSKTFAAILKNGENSNEMFLAPLLSSLTMTINALEDGYFLLYPAGRKPDVGLSKEMRSKIATEPNDVFRSVNASSTNQVRIFKQDGNYMLSALLPEEAQKDFACDAVIRRLTAQLPDGEKSATSEFISQTLQTSIVEVNGEKLLAVECPLSGKTLEMWGQLLRLIRDEEIAANAPHVISV